MAITNLRPVYLTVKEQTDNVIARYNNRSFIKDPSVDIEAVAENMGIKIEYIESKQIFTERAYFDRKNKIIYVNKNNSREQQRFSIAHEIGHYIEKEILKNLSVNDEIDIPFEGIIHKKIERLVARYDNHFRIKTNRIFSEAAKIFAPGVTEVAFEKIGRSISVEKAFLVTYKMLCEEITRAADLIKLREEIFIDATNKTIREELADYSAANLLVPTERFLLWEGKSTWSLARAFQVNTACIKKRKKEAAHEEEFLKPDTVSFDGELEEKPPLLLDELQRFLGGYSVNPGQA
jgi:Zn-dependent peptidase ImmA (M78 family)